MGISKNILITFYLGIESRELERVKRGSFYMIFGRVKRHCVSKTEATLSGYRLSLKLKTKSPQNTRQEKIPFHSSPPPIFNVTKKPLISFFFITS
ncbi:hypothetical protein YC2023_032862 [Brassica napus]